MQCTHFLLVVERVAETPAPVTEVGRNDEAVGGVIKVGREEFAVEGLSVIRSKNITEYKEKKHY